MANLVLGSAALLALVVNFAEHFYYPNFVYSHFRISPGQVNMVFGVLVICYLYNRKIRLRHSVLGLLIVGLSLFLIVSRLPEVAGVNFGRFAGVVTRSNFSPEEKLRLVWGNRADFFAFLLANTSETSSIILPPETLPWRYTGSSQFLEPYLYPRRVRSVSVPYYRDNFTEFDYLVISSEEDGAPSHLWPDFSVPASQIRIFSWGEGPDEVITDTDWNPQDWQSKKPWGLITVKKGDHER